MGLFDVLKKTESQKKKPKLPVSVKDKVVETKSADVDLVPVEEDTIVKEIIKPKVIYVKKIVVSTYNDLKRVSEEVSAGNIVVVDLSPLESKQEILAKVAEQLQMSANTFGWGIASLCRETPKILITPPDIKIMKE
ncbi:cell division protein SepF [Pyrococcus sp. ST04]|uniref:cell division protein SepF n=1 Tax=Pyrococcus sp. ST04 TaxID=1183377 RepID=UPI0002605F3F|nr:hypothetical protein Py04_1710 [Pyrococcus sp. ST04]